MYLQGGLGNQLFGWAAGYTRAAETNSELILNISQLYQRGFQLGEFDLPPYEVEINKQKFQCINKYIPKFFLHSTYYENDFTFNSHFRENLNLRNLHGYFQSWKYFDSNFQNIRNILKKPIANRSSNYQKMKAIFDDENVIAVHIRRGDYVGLEHFHGLIGPKFYKNAMRLASDSYPRHKVALFSDDINEALKIFKNVDYTIDETLLPSSVETLLLMSEAKSIIGANSSFSLWASYLSSNTNINIFPQKWFTEKQHVMSDLLLPHFFTLET